LVSGTPLKGITVIKYKFWYHYVEDLFEGLSVLELLNFKELFCGEDNLRITQ
jgi:hypothetical protein